MAEYIEREAALGFMNEVEPCICRNSDGVVFTATKDKDMLEYLRSIPAADVVPARHGRFLGTEYDGYADGNPVYYEWQCSECGCVFEDDEPTYNYCPNCGARMDGDGE